MMGIILLVIVVVDRTNGRLLSTSIGGGRSLDASFFYVACRVSRAFYFSSSLFLVHKFEIIFVGWFEIHPPFFVVSFR